MTLTKLFIKPRRIPLQMHIHNFYGDLDKGYFKLYERYFCKSFALEREAEGFRSIVWKIVPMEFRNNPNLILAWPYHRDKRGNFIPLQYCETIISA